MLSATEFRDLLSGQRRGFRAAVWRSGLRLLEVPYAVAIAWRNRRYDRDKTRIHRVNVPVISVGNLTVGGTGKTPFVEWLARWFRQEGLRVTLISRGYRPAAGARNDEALELEQRLPDVPHLQNADRVSAAQVAMEELECQLILLDDGFQHRRLHRDLDLVLIDALEPFGYGHLLPRGLLREPLTSLARSDVVVLSRCDLVSADQRARILDQIRRHAPSALHVEIAHRPQSLLAWPAAHEPISGLVGKPVAAFCGIGNPEGFRQTLTRCGADVVAFRTFPDHHPYPRHDVEDLVRWVRDVSARSAICTHKDLVKIQRTRLGKCDLRALVIGVEILAGHEALADRLRRLISEWKPDSK